jgi:5S rRNA maturation endonuclease (ribonuclease M5)
MNVLVGPNNCGKSNFLSAVALAMNRDFDFQPNRDIPVQMSWAFPRVLLDFQSDGKSSPEKTLLRYAEEYERSVVGDKATYAESGTLRFVVTYTGNAQSGRSRQEFFVARGAGNRRGDSELAARLVKQFKNTCRFVLVRSGESLEDLLAGRFREILHLVLRDHLASEIAEAEVRRDKYINDLKGGLFAPLREHLDNIVCQLFPEVTSTTLTPKVPALDETLSHVGISITDSAETELVDKGTGVRGGVLVAMLRYLAERTRRSMVFAVEEPEAFLHPAAQEVLRQDLEKLAERGDVTLLVTTHSPFIVPSSSNARISALRKHSDGRTVIAGTAQGNERKTELLGDLFRDPALPDLLEQVATVPVEVSAVLVVEGTTDRDYLEVAAKLTGRSALLQRLYIAPAGGATRAVVQTILYRHRAGRPVLTLLDFDEPGRRARDYLKTIFELSDKREILLYNKVASARWKDVEAEDLWPSELIQGFVDELGELALQERLRRPDGTWHIGLSAEGKGEVPMWLARNAKRADCDLWAQLLDELENRIAKVAASR